jgi:hypothetical protein
MPQSVSPPQPLPILPQKVAAAELQGVGVQVPESGAAPQTFGVPAPPHVKPPAQFPQSISPPQPSPTLPQYDPVACLQTVAAHVPESREAPHTLGVPAPPHVNPLLQPPQSTDDPQLFPTTPQYLPVA